MRSVYSITAVDAFYNCFQFRPKCMKECIRHNENEDLRNNRELHGLKMCLRWTSKWIISRLIGKLSHLGLPGTSNNEASLVQ